MGTQAPKSARVSKSQNSTPSKSPSSSLSSHLATIELKQRILTSLSKLSDRDTYQIAVEDLEKIIQTHSPEGLSMLLNCLYDATNDPKPAVKKEALRLLGFLCATHGESTATHLTKIIAHIIRRLKDSDSSVREACRDAIGTLSSLYLKGDGGENGGLGSVVAIFVKPLFEAMNEQNKVVQGGSAMCMAKMVECSPNPPLASFQKLCPKICKFLNSPNYLAKASLLQVISSLSQVRAIAPQSMEPFLQSIFECIGSADWATRKAAADTLIALASHSSNLITDSASTIEVLEGCRFDKIKPVRDSITEALQLWKKIAGGGGDDTPNDQKASSHGGETSKRTELSERNEPNVMNHFEKVVDALKKLSPGGSSPKTSVSKGNTVDILDKAAGKLKKKTPTLTDKEFNPEFFQKLETRGSVEVVVPRRCQNSLSMQNEGEQDQNNTSCKGSLKDNGQTNEGSGNHKYHSVDEENSGVYGRQRRDFDDLHRNNSTDEKADGKESRTNWVAIQRQLLQMERQQAHLMSMLQDFMGGSHHGMVTLENRVRGLERVVEDMARDLSISAGRRSGNFMAGFDGSSNRFAGNHNGFSEYSGPKMGRSGDGRVRFGDRFNSSDSIASATRGRGNAWRSDVADAWDFGGQMGSKRFGGSGLVDVRSPKSEHESDRIGNKRGWDKGAGPFRLGEGPSARSVWQASKDEATLEAIRIAGEDNGTTRSLRVPIPEMTAESLVDSNNVPERDPIWNSWNNAMESLHVGEVDSAYAEVLSTGDDLLLVKLMDRSGAVVDQLSHGIVSETFQALSQFLQEQNLFDICLSWIYQLTDLVMENGPDVLRIPAEVKRELLVNFREACSAYDPPQGYEGPSPEQLLLQLSSAWKIDLQRRDD